MTCSEIGGCIEDYDVFEPVGKGGFATVYRARCRNTKIEVAIKKINKNILTKTKIIDRVRQEVSIHSKLDHPSILKLYTFFEDDQFVNLVLELCQNGNLSQQIPFHENKAREYLTQVVNGLLYLHSQRIMHRDLSLQNLLLDFRDRIKIADFGLATQLKKPDDKHMTMCGTPNYISPEVATRSSHGLQADVWSLGCILYTMLVGKSPFEMKNAKSTLTKVVIGNYEIPSSVSSQATDLIHQCLVKNPQKRIKLREVLSHPFFDPIPSEYRSSNTCGSDSGMYTLSTNGTTHHNRAPLTAIGEEQEHFSGSLSEFGQNGLRKDAVAQIRMNSPPVRLKANPHEQSYPPNGGMFGNLKKKLARLPTMNEPPSFPYTGGQYLQEFKGVNLPTAPTAKYTPTPLHEGDASHRYYTPNHSVHVNDNEKAVRGNSGSAQERGHCYYEVPVRDVENNHSYTSAHESGYSASDSRNRQPVKGYHEGGPMREETEHRPCRSDRRNAGRSRRSISSEGRLVSTKEECHYPPDHMRSNSLNRNCRDLPYSGNRENRSHTSDCRCSTCQTDGFYDGQSHHSEAREACSVCRSYNHTSWCNRNQQMTRSAQPNNHQQESNHNQHSRHSHKSSQQNTNHHSRHSHKSSHSDTRSTDILKDIPPVKRIPSPVTPMVDAPPILPAKTPSLRAQCSPLSSRRLKATRQESKNAILNILDDGEVCVEFLHMKKNVKRVRDVCRISPDGLRIVLYQPNGSYGAVVTDTPPPLPSEGADLMFSFDSLPQKFWKKYIYASRFVKLVKERTPKVTYYSDQAHCSLMENAPNPDFIAKFYTSEKFLLSSGNVQFTERSGKQISVAESEADTAFAPNMSTLYNHVLQVKRHCLALEEVLTRVEEAEGFPNFPVVIGRRPAPFGSTAGCHGNGNDNKENVSPMSEQSIRRTNELAQLEPYDGSLGSMASAHSKFRTPLTPVGQGNALRHSNNAPTNKRQQKVYVENVGYLFQDGNEMVLNFLDGSHLQMNAYRPVDFIYSDENGRHSYPINSSIPTALRKKLSQFQKALDRMKPAGSENNAFPKQPTYPVKNPLLKMNGLPSALPKYIR